VSKNGQALAEKSDATAPTHDGGQEVDGYYNCELDATDTNTCGILTLACFATGALSVRHDYVVLEEAIYDALFAASANAFSGAAGSTTLTALAAGSITATVIATGAIDADAIADNAIDAGAIAADAITAAKIADGAIDAATFATGAITATAIAADAIGASELAADAVAEIADAMWDEDATAHQNGGTFGQAIGDPGASTETLFKAIITDPAGTNIAADVIAIKAETAAILADTAEIGAAGAGLTVLATQASVNTIDDFLDTEVAAILAAVDTEVAAILADTNELQTDWVDGGRLDLILDARASQASVDDLPTNAELATALAAADDAVLAAIAALENLSAAEVNAEVVDALATDTYAEPGQGSPAATAALSAKIGYLYKAWRNRHTQDASEYALYADDGTTKDQEAAVSDNGTTFDRGEVGTGA
jgi:hypothetical protein